MNKSEEIGNNSSIKKNVNRYNNAKVYKLINTIDNTFYIGSTCASLAHRFYSHKEDAKREERKNNKLYGHLNKIGFENIKIILINEFYLDNKEQLLREENNYIEMYKNDPNCLNSRLSYRTDEFIKEYIKNKKAKHYIKYKNEISEKQKKYRENNKEKIKERKCKLYTCICGSENSLFDHKSRHEMSKKHQNFIKELKEEAQTI